MATINFYLDTASKKGFSPIHLIIYGNNKRLKISTGEKVKINDFDKETQLIKETAGNNIEVNHYLTFLKERANELINKSYKKTITTKEIKKILNDYIKGYKENHNVNIVNEQLG